MKLGRDTRPDVKLRWMGQDRGAICEALKLSFVLNGTHTVNIYRYTPGRRGNSKDPSIRREIDVMSIGDFATGEVTYDDFKRAVMGYIEECIRYDRHLMAEAHAWPQYAEPEAFERVYGRPRDH